MKEKDMLPSFLPFHLLLFLSIAQADKVIFILAGQSNMAGRGGVFNNKWDNVIPPESHSSPSVLRLNAHLQWEPASEPLHFDIDVNKTCGVGPGMPFANSIDPSVGQVLGLVPCAVGGTRISEWARGTSLYEDMVTRGKAALKEGGRIEAVLWFQGESDTVSLADAEAYKGRMEQLIADMRSDFGLPELLVIQVALASGEGKYIERVRGAQKKIKLSNVICVDAKGLALEGDHLHLTTTAQVHLGKMLATAYLNHHAISAHQFSNF